MAKSNKKINEELIKEVALALGDLNNQVVYVGGSVVSLYADDPAAEDVRPTKDIDIFLEIATYGKLVKLQETLARKGFYPEQDQEIMCRFKYKDILIDIMTTKEVGWASADRWFEPGLKTIQKYQIGKTTINILHLSYFLATKFNAFWDRNEDARFSRHFEDIIFVLDNRVDLINDILNSPDDVKNYLVQQFDEMLTKQYEETILSHLSFHSQVERFKLLKAKLIEIVNSV